MIQFANQQNVLSSIILLFSNLCQNCLCFTIIVLLYIQNNLGKFSLQTNQYYLNVVQDFRTCKNLNYSQIKIYNMISYLTPINIILWLALLIKIGLLFGVIVLYKKFIVKQIKYQVYSAYKIRRTLLVYQLLPFFLYSLLFGSFYKVYLQNLREDCNSINILNYKNQFLKYIIMLGFTLLLQIISIIVVITISRQQQNQEQKEIKTKKSAWNDFKNRKATNQISVFQTQRHIINTTSKIDTKKQIKQQQQTPKNLQIQDYFHIQNQIEQNNQKKQNQFQLNMQQKNDALKSLIQQNTQKINEQKQLIQIKLNNESLQKYRSDQLSNHISQWNNQHPQLFMQSTLSTKSRIQEPVQMRIKTKLHSNFDQDVIKQSFQNENSKSNVLLEQNNAKANNQIKDEIEKQQSNQTFTRDDKKNIQQIFQPKNQNNLQIEDY